MLCQVCKYAFICFVNSEIINQIVMELVVIEKHAYLQLKLQIESLSAQIESVKKKIGPAYLVPVYGIYIIISLLN